MGCKITQTVKPKQKKQNKKNQVNDQEVKTLIFEHFSVKIDFLELELLQV